MAKAQLGKYRHRRLVNAAEAEIKMAQKARRRVRQWLISMLDRPPVMRAEWEKEAARFIRIDADLDTALATALMHITEACELIDRADDPADE